MSGDDAGKSLARRSSRLGLEMDVTKMSVVPLKEIPGE